MDPAFQFAGKNIFLLSPEKWGTMRISKHHYALELAKAGARVFFVEPPDLSRKGVEVQASEEAEGLFIVRYKPVFRGRRFLPRRIYEQLIRAQIRLLIRAAGCRPDLVWCFDPSRFRNLRWFKAPRSLYFAADLFPDGKVSGEALSADCCVGISDTIVSELKARVQAPVFFIHHGLSNLFVPAARRRLEALEAGISEVPVSSALRVGYVGSLVHEALDRKTMREVITRHPAVQFVFWGQYERKGNFVAYESEEVFSFIEFLQAQPNVQLRGAVGTERLSQEMESMDLFWLCWDLQKPGMWDGSNSHKVMEYLSTGRPVVSHYMSTYKDSALLDMLSGKSNDDYPALFSRVLERASKGEDPAQVRERISFALSNTYACHIDSIRQFLTEADR